MARPRAILKRRKAVRNIHKITRTMQLIAMARFQRARDQAAAFKRYSDTLAQMIDRVRAHAKLEHPMLRTIDSPRRSAMLVISSNRGFCGGYNAQVLDAALASLRRQQDAGVHVELSVFGKKGLGYMKFAEINVDHAHVLDDETTYDQIEPFADQFRSDFMDERLDTVYVAYMRFHTPSRQHPHVLQVLPIAQPSTPTDQQTIATRYHEYQFHPQADRLLGELLPQAVNATFYQCFSDAAVSEHAARIIAMQSASDNADEMITHLTQQANRARQAQITADLTELMIGSDAA